MQYFYYAARHPTRSAVCLFPFESELPVFISSWCTVTVSQWLDMSRPVFQKRAASLSPVSAGAFCSARHCHIRFLSSFFCLRIYSPITGTYICQMSKGVFLSERWIRTHVSISLYSKKGQIILILNLAGNEKSLSVNFLDYRLLITRKTSLCEFWCTSTRKRKAWI